MLEITSTDEWRGAHPGAMIGLLEVSGAENTGPSPRLEKVKRETEARLKERFGGYTRADFLALPVMAAYARYYRRFSKTYHVFLQVESIALKSKGLPDVSPLVDANFTAEVETHVLTAGHDAARLQGALRIDIAREGEHFTQPNGMPKALQAGDMVMRDAGGVGCSIIYGQDNRSLISAATTHALYVAYAPVGVPAESVNGQLEKIEEHVRLFSPGAVVQRRCLLAA